MKFGHLILRKIITIVATRCQIRFRLAPHPTGEAYSAPPDPIAGFKGPTSKGRKEGEERERKGGEEKERMEGRRGEFRHLFYPTFTTAQQYALQLPQL